MAAISAIRQKLQKALGSLRGDLKAHEIDPRAGQLVERSLARLLHALLDL
jgi:hypothetical protein